jgi:hypothetical protein
MGARKPGAPLVIEVAAPIASVVRYNVQELEGS